MIRNVDLKYTNEQHTQIISQMMEIASRSRGKAISGINAIINSYSLTPLTETIEMAYLDNKLFDFKNKEKSIALKLENDNLKK